MSGGSLNYLYQKVEEAVDLLENEWAGMGHPLEESIEVLAGHLKLVAKAMHDMEWVLSGDYGPGDEVEAVKAMLAAPTLPSVQEVPQGAQDWKRVALVQDAKLRVLCEEPGSFKKLCDTLEKYDERMMSKLTPTGWRLVPIDPTDAMLDAIAGTKWCELNPSKQAAEVAAYSKMLSVAPKSTKESK